METGGRIRAAKKKIKKMELEQFIALYDVPGSVVLLEGKREVREEDRAALVTVGRLLATKTKHLVFRSGNAQGSDALFSEGVASVSRDRLEVITPFDNHRQRTNLAATTHSLDSMNLAAEDGVVYHSKQHANTKHLVDKYVSGQRDRYAIKAAYILRDTVKVLGTADIPQATAGVFCDDLSNPNQGGTGHTMRVCRDHEVPVFTQEVWMKWL